MSQFSKPAHRPRKLNQAQSQSSPSKAKASDKKTIYKSSPRKNTRALAAQAIFDVLERGISLSAALPTQQQQLINPQDKGLLAEICYGVMRHLPQLDLLVSQHLAKPFKGKQRIAYHLLLVGVYQLFFTRIPAHAAISETAEACRQMQFEGLVKVINGVLRTIQRQIEDAENKGDNAHSILSEANDTLRYNTPAWIIKSLQQAYPQQWQQIIEQSHQRPPMWLRNNAKQQTRAQYIQQLESTTGGPGLVIGDIDGSLIADNAILLSKASDVGELPNFAEGAVSVQDGAAQWAAQLLAPQNGELILDACAAPGGKTCHILETAPDANVIAVDFDAQRLTRVQENLDRLKLKAEVIHGDAADIPSWWTGAAHGQQFDRILLDAPCSATGVIRRHPDIKWLRKAKDIEALATLQAQILDHCWQHLKVGGHLLYATCSIMPQENSEQIKAFLARTPEAKLEPIAQQSDLSAIGWQILPGDQGMDGFYYARLYKKA